MDEETDSEKARTYQHAENIAAFLSAEYVIESLEQKVCIAELAAEMAQRLAEELPGPSMGSRQLPKL